MTTNSTFEDSVCGRSAWLRFRVALNLFKQHLLGDLHMPGKAQTVSVFEALGDAGIEWKLTERTWQSWFSNSSTVPKLGKIEVLDRAAADFGRSASRLNEGSSHIFPEGFFKSLVVGGFIQELLSPSKTKHSLQTLVGRAASYRPMSALHLHFDAVDACGQLGGFGDVPWTRVKEVAASRILQLVEESWGPRHGAIFRQLPSDCRLAWQVANDDERRQMRRELNRWGFDMYSDAMNAGAYPNWSLTRVSDDASWPTIHKTMFAIAADEEFLRADRLIAWALDLATAGLGMHGLGWSNRYETFGLNLSSEKIWWGALEGLFFAECPRGEIEDDVKWAMMECKAAWTASSVDTIIRGGDAYREEMADLGITSKEILNIAMSARNAYPLVYSPLS